MWTETHPKPYNPLCAVLCFAVFEAKGNVAPPSCLQASYGVEDPEYAVTQLAQTTMRSELGKLTLDKVFRVTALAVWSHPGGT